jgi:hypothetical protein
MPTVAQEAYEVAKAARDANGELDWKLYEAEYERRLAERHRRLMTDARAAYRAMDGWGRLGSQEEWDNTVAEARDRYDRGAFLIDQLGAERHLDPTLMAVLLRLRRGLVDEHGATTSAELMVIDMAVLAFYHSLRINGWIGNFAALIECEFFQQQSLTAKFTDRYGRHNDTVRGLRVEDHVGRLAEQLLPLLDRCNRMMLRNLKALKSMREGPAPSVSIGSAGHVNVAMNQANGMRDGAATG